MARANDFDLAAALATPSFTPGKRDAAGLAALVVAGVDPTAQRAQKALASLDVARSAVDGAWDAADEAGRTRLVIVLGLLARAGDGAAVDTLLARVDDAAPRVRRAAIAALGKLGLRTHRSHDETEGAHAIRSAAARSSTSKPQTDDPPGATDADSADQAPVRAREALLARWQRADLTPEEKRSLAEALGKLGGEAALSELRSLDAKDDRELARRRDRAVLMADRDAKRDLESEIAIDLPPPRDVVQVRLGCRTGLATLLADELRALGFAITGTTDRDVDITLDRPWSALHASRLWATAAIRVSLLPGGELAERITRTILGEDVRGLFAAWTRGAIRWRLGFTSGHKRAIVWRVARDVTAAAPQLINDPTATTWDILVEEDPLGYTSLRSASEARTSVPYLADQHPSREILQLIPRRAPDPRFAWRTADVPAASHPTIAAALARVAGARPDDVVWDPFCGSGSELVERALLGPVARLYGTDLDETALAASRANFASAKIEATLALADARVYSCHPVSLVITNPPLGSRVQVDAAALLVESLENFERQMGPGARLVWITPSTRRTSPAAAKLGLQKTVDLRVDLGGVHGHLERWEKPA